MKTWIACLLLVSICPACGQVPDYIQKAADDGDVKAEVVIGNMYSKGDGVPQDYGKAMAWYRKAADQGNDVAQEGIGLMYLAGQSVPKDYAQAFTWYKMAADQGNDSAESTVGELYLLGQGVPQDNGKAMEWYRKAADQGYADAGFHIGEMYENGDGVSKDQAQSTQWYQKAADNGDLRAKASLARLVNATTSPAFEASLQSTTSSEPPSTIPPDGTASDLTPVIKDRIASINELRNVLSSPNATPDQKQQGTALALQLLSADSDLLAIDQAALLLLKLKIEKLGGNPAIQTLFTGGKISFTTLDGKSYKDAQITSINTDSFSVITSDGGATVQMDNVQKDLQDKLGYQPPADPSQVPNPSPDGVAPAASDVPLTTVSGNPLHDGINIIDIDAKQIEDHGDNVVIAWQVKLYNKADDSAGTRWVDISFRDGSDFEVEKDSEESTLIPANGPVTVTSRYTMDKKVWQSVKSYVAKLGP